MGFLLANAVRRRHSLVVMAMYDELSCVSAAVGSAVSGWYILWGNWAWTVSVGMVSVVITWAADWAYCCVVNGWMDVELVSGVRSVNSV